jgi:hypothetical protein
MTSAESYQWLSGSGSASQEEVNESLAVARGGRKVDRGDEASALVVEIKES